MWLGVDEQFWWRDEFLMVMGRKDESGGKVIGTQKTKGGANVRVNSRMLLHI